jgi:hypothetical protein
MPREATAYLCAFKCGRHATLNRKAVETHERTCARNPGARTCKTCKHNEVERAEQPEFDGAVMVYPGKPGSYGCAIEMKPPHVVMVSQCPQWEVA